MTFKSPTLFMTSVTFALLATCASVGAHACQSL